MDERRKVATDTAVTYHAIEQVNQLAGGAVLPRCLHAVVNLGIADALDDDPQTAATLAAATGLHAEALGRVLRLLAANGVFECRDGLFSHTPASRLLRADHPQSMRPLARMMGLPIHWMLSGEIEHSLRTGAPAVEKALPGGIWSYLSQNVEAGRLFEEAMTAKAYAQVRGVVSTYDFSRFTLVGDIGGGQGHLLQGILKNAQSVGGVLFDQSHVIERVLGVASDRLKLHGGDFFTDQLPACDAYLLMDVIHDWDDERALAILKNVRRAARHHAVVLIVEAIIADSPGPNWPRTMDIWMLTIGGKQRTQQEFSALFAQAGFRFTREIDTHAGASIIEAVTAD